eukprot:CAMPEP_0180644988 /NCGR_PEP_ID=MMETSP1037_2-20121125/48724_1 /TAXON_ID=632150 /ORGANISM="Azadinium spinosum, Strain 3D9" /LENGTH=31 /DNA_ID= /DNA_START= /DNA_END= /DNA_ORIENTATION=
MISLGAPEPAGTRAGVLGLVPMGRRAHPKKA